MRSSFAKLLKTLQKRWPKADMALVRAAYRKADEAHKGQERLSGEPYINHGIQVAHILAGVGLDPVTCAAGLLHDTIEDTSVTMGQLEREFGPEVAELVDGVTKLSALSFPEERITSEIKQAQNIRKMLVATAKDVRVILIKLADRLHNLRTIEPLPENKRHRISQETLEIYAPIAHRLGISNWKWELEDRAFAQLMPAEYHAIARQVAMKRQEREAELKDVIDFLSERLTEAEVNAHVIGRPKHLYSIYTKMVRQGKDFYDVHDILGVRIITQTKGCCYNALGVVHGLWTPIPGRLKDYIAMPKHNLYQAIHTTVMQVNGRPMEVQIRSDEMDRIAREGIAAHWSYKEGEKHRDKKLDDQLAWLRQTYEWLKDANTAEELMEAMRKDFGVANVYAFTPKGEVKELPNGATALDFAYMVHSDVGHQCIGVRVNSRMVPLRYHIQTGDIVEILTSRNQVPHRDWIDICMTGRARTRIRQKLRELGELEPADDPSSKAARNITPHAAVRPKAAAPQRKVQRVDNETRLKLIQVDGQKGLEVQFAKCCDPMPGNAVLGYIAKAHIITIHRADCPVFEKSRRDPERIVAAAWEGDRTYSTTIRVTIGPRPNVLADITNALRPLNLDMLRAEYAPAGDGKSTFEFAFDASDESMVERVLRTLRTVTGVSDAMRLERRTEPAALVEVG